MGGGGEGVRERQKSAIRGGETCRFHRFMQDCINEFAALEHGKFCRKYCGIFLVFFLFLRIIRVQSKVIAGLSAIYIVIYEHKEVRG